MSENSHEQAHDELREETRKVLRDVLQEVWGYEDFRGVQFEVIYSLLHKNDTLGLMPTGCGKSICFQLPALVLEGVCIVITPLIALMTDQVTGLKKRNILAETIHMGMSSEEQSRILDNCILGKTKLLYVSPERLESENFLDKLRRMKISFVCVDEAHCISQWGYNFRPSYLRIANIRKELPNVTFLALTATATPKVAEDIMDKLKFKEPKVFSMSFVRDNLNYVVRDTEFKHTELQRILTAIQGSTIIYTRTRDDVKETCELLQRMGFSATYYHAGLDEYDRKQRQLEWIQDKVKIMVATNAFGMGIDKPDVRLVVHMFFPDSIEAYYQEAGRAGRDGKTAWAVLLHTPNYDKKWSKNVLAFNYPSKKIIGDVYEHLAYYYQVAMGSRPYEMKIFNTEKFSRIYHFHPNTVTSALRILDQSGYIYYEDLTEARTRVKFILLRDQLYKLKDLSGRDDALVCALLRTYTGLFSDLTYISEDYIADLMYGSDEKTKVAKNLQDVTLGLQSLARQGIIEYIPSRATPTITYARERVEVKSLRFPDEVYKSKYEKEQRLLESVYAYVSNNKDCRTVQLVNYFGEQNATDCGHCDVCLAKRKRE